MGAYASQLTPKQRWNIIHYIKVKQGKVGATAPATAEPADSGNMFLSPIATR
jgi:hypothetical protein